VGSTTGGKWTERFGGGEVKLLGPEVDDEKKPQNDPTESTSFFDQYCVLICMHRMALVFFLFVDI
jgi:hypothetical protein